MDDRSKPLSIGDIITLILKEQPEIQNVAINVSVLTWFNIEVMQLLTSDPLSEGQAQETLKRILDLSIAQPFQDIGYSYHEDIRLNLLGRLHKQPDRAIAVHKRSIGYLNEQLEQQADSLNADLFRRELGHQFLGLGGIYFQKEDYKSSIEYLRLSAEQFEKTASRRYLAEASYQLGRACLGQKDFDSAVENYRNSIQTWKGVDDELVKRRLTELGAALVAESEWERADGVYQEFISSEVFGDSYVQESHRGIVADYYSKKASLHREQKNWNEALGAYEQAKEYYELGGDLQSSKQMEQEIELFL